jgi:phosphohistidine phosphatase
MDLILWRHAEAEDPGPGQSDLERQLTARGRKQAKRMAAWLDQVLPESCKILVSPARRCLQTMEALDRKYRLCPEIAPDAGLEALLQASNWPHAKGPIMLVGHQPDLGSLAGQLLFGQPVSLGVRKASVWWLASREDEATGVLRAVMSPELAPK